MDMDSTGLLILTNDGALTYQLTHPKFEHEKEYLVQIEGTLQPREKQNLEHGVKLEDGMTAPAIIKEVRAAPFNYSLIIHEGKKRQIRRMFAHLGYRVLALKRIRMGSLTLGALERKPDQTIDRTGNQIFTITRVARELYFVLIFYYFGYYRHNFMRTRYRDFVIIWYFEYFNPSVSGTIRFL